MAEKRLNLKISNMTCASCEMRIEGSVGALAGVRSAKAKYGTGMVMVIFDDKRVSEKEIKGAIISIGYKIANEKNRKKSSPHASSKTPKKKKDGLIGIVLIVIALYLVLDRFGLLNMIPEVDASMGYFALFAVGLITSLHCTAMCGGINIAQCMSYKQEKSRASTLLPSLLYNAGRVVSYTVVGGMVGALGSVISFSGYAKGLVALIAGVFMVIMGLNMLNLFPWLKRLTPRMPRFFGKKIHNKNNYGPFVVGLLNGLMPCGPLQAMQIYALGTGSMVAGAVSMFLFSLGTVPLMFGLGALSSFLKGKSTEKMLKVGAVLVIVLGIAMLNNGMALSGISINLSEAGQKGTAYANAATIKGDVQEITTILGRSYSPITVQRGIPVKWTIQAEGASINGCNNELQIPKYNITKKLVPGDNVIEFMPEASGTIPYSCWMGMIRSNISVVDDLAAIQLSSSVADIIPTDEIAVASIKNDKQYVQINMNDKRFTPAVVVMQAGIDTEWIIKGEKMTLANRTLYFPRYNAQYRMQEGTNTIEFVPDADFDFSTSDYGFYGYVKVVEDIKTIDRQAIKDEIKNYTPLYQPSGSTGGVGGASCH